MLVAFPLLSTRDIAQQPVRNWQFEAHFLGFFILLLNCILLHPQPQTETITASIQLRQHRVTCILFRPSSLTAPKSNVY